MTEAEARSYMAQAAKAFWASGLACDDVIAGMLNQRDHDSMNDLVSHAAVVEIAMAAQPAKPTDHAIPLEWAAEQPEEIDAPRQIVEGVLTAGTMSVVYGESNSGKSYMVAWLGWCVSRGEAWLGKRTVKGTVIYIAAEGAWSIRTRLAAARKHTGNQPGHFGLIPCALSFLDPSLDVEALIDLVHAKVLQGECPEVSLIIVDTVARVMGGANENASEDMSRLVAAGDRLREATGAHVLFIHHSGKDAAKGARGHSSLRAAVDTEIEVTADENTHTHTARITKQRDLPSKGERIAGRFVSVELGTDQWGNAVTACVVEPVELAALEPVKPRPLPINQQAVLGYLAGQRVGVRKSMVVDALTAQGLKRQTIYASIAALIEAERITDTAGLIYAPKS